MSVLGAIGAGIGALTGGIGNHQKQVQYNRDKELAARIEQNSPWTGVHGKMPEAPGSAFGDMLGGATSMGLQGNNIASAGGIGGWGSTQAPMGGGSAWGGDFKPTFGGAVNFMNQARPKSQLGGGYSILGNDD